MFLNARECDLRQYSVHGFFFFPHLGLCRIETSHEKYTNSMGYGWGGVFSWFSIFFILFPQKLLVIQVFSFMVRRTRGIRLETQN